MNQIYRVIFSKAAGCFVPVAENVTGQGKGKSQSTLIGTRTAAVPNPAVSKSIPFKQKLLYALMCAGLSAAGLWSQQASADTFIATVESAGIQQSTSTFSSAGMETFDARSVPNFSTNFGTQLGTTPLTAGISGSVSAGGLNSADLYGGAGGTGKYAFQGGTLSLSSPVNYFGLWISALDANTITFYSSPGGSSLYSFGTATMRDLVGSSSATNGYYGNPNYIQLGRPDRFSADGNEPFAFVNFYNTTGTFSYITLTGGGFESDNWTVGTYTSISGRSPNASDIVSGTNSTNLVSNLNNTINPVFDGGTLKASASEAIASNFTIATGGATIDSSGYSLIVSGAITNASGVTGSLIIKNSTGNGSITLGGINTYTGSTTIDSGASLKLSGSGSIAYSSGLANSGSFDISATTSGASLKDITGSGTTALGNQTLTLTNPSGTTYSGIISGAGGIVNITSGTKILSGVNTYSGGTQVQTGATLQVASSSAIGTGALTLNGNSTTAATFKPTADMVVSNDIKIFANGMIDQLGNTVTLAGQVVNDVSGAGKLIIINTGANQGAVILAANNTYTGGTEVNAGATLKITSASSIGSGKLELIGSPTVAAVLKYGNDMTFTNTIGVSGDPTFDVTGKTVIQSGAITDILGQPSGEVVVTVTDPTQPGTYILTTVNTYTGDTKIDPGSTLVLSGAGSIATSGTGTGWTGVINNGTFNIAPVTSNTVSLGKNYTQSSSGTLGMNWYQTLSIPGTASLAGSLTLFNSNNSSYSLGRYTLVASTGALSGAFSTLNTANLSTRYKYSLSYDANDAYLDIAAGGPPPDYTQQSLVNTAQALQGTFALQNSILNSSLGYDCNVFGPNGICISAGGRNTAVQAEGINNTSALLIAAYKAMPNVRIGAYADQNLSTQGPGTVKLGNNTPLLGLFAAWNEKDDGTGLELKASASYGQKTATVTRGVVVTSEPGSGSSNLTTQGAQILGRYGFAVTPSTLVTPYLGLRYGQTNLGGYTEGASTSVTAPLTYQALNTNATTVLAGASASHQLTPKTTVFASAGIESDTNTSNGSYSATSPNIAGLTPINFNPTAVKNRPTATVGAYYDLEKNQRLALTAGYTQTPYRAVSTTTVMTTYTIGF
ncbi:autotransporter domain-containing protein [Polynucleobacter sp. CS-Odin-A6]|uniref:Npun_F0296 family exosortase-dependent surface protein n=1 Tax=Polynucleobacter sp. CS-Odin-A6 TaxID=2689106 RepID=UPI001C0E008E|nr:autotransporter domain-containing protein [Polynucleobacter sp. CS-Odin-A6]MBU3620242.1 hypothetical protein [Polynucleobacter sp. CS-Odin-A6]